MVWNLVDPATEDEISEYNVDFRRTHGFSFIRKPVFFVDENIGKGTTETIRNFGFKCFDVWEEGLIGHPDENVAAAARRKQSILLTHDDDFLDEAIYPLKLCWGVGVFPFADGPESDLVKSLADFLNYASVGAGTLYQTKIHIRADGSWDLTRLSLDKQIVHARYRLEKHGKISIDE